MKKLLFSITLLTAGLGAMAALPEGMGYGKYTLDELEAWGTAKAESYDIAVKFSGEELGGKEIIGFTVPVVEAPAGAFNYKVWLTKALTLEKNEANVKVNVPDIVTVDATPVNGRLEVTFAEPVTVPTTGIYAGYSIEVANSEISPRYPVMRARENVADGFYLHTSSTYRSWMNCSKDLFSTSPLLVIVKDETAAPYSVAAVELGSDAIRAGKDFSLPLTIENHGLNEVRTIGYSYEAGPYSGSGTLELQYPVPNMMGRQSVVKIPFSAMEIGGTYEPVVTVTHVNGELNSDPNSSVQGYLSIVAFDPKRRSVLEEYTATTCQYCPRGWLGLEMMYEKYPSFIGISYHSGDVMTMYNGFPAVANTLPLAFLDRERITDAYFGDLPSNQYGFGIDEVWAEQCEKLAIADIEMSTEWLDAEKTKLKVDTKSLFVAESPDEYRVEYVLIASGLQKAEAKWAQYNNYVGQEEWLGCPGMDVFVNGEMATNPIYNFEYNYVAVLTSGLKGVAGSLADRAVGQPIEHSYTFDLTNAKSTSHENLIHDKDRLKVVAMLLKTDDSYGVVENANICDAGGKSEPISIDPAHVEETLSAGEPVAVEYYSLQGVRLAGAPEHEMYVSLHRYADGKVKSVKRIK